LPGWQSRNDVKNVLRKRWHLRSVETPFAEHVHPKEKKTPKGKNYTSHPNTDDAYESVDDLLSSENVDFVDICTRRAAMRASSNKALEGRSPRPL